MQFVLVRHVETVANVEHRFNGWVESPLTEHGKKMKEKVVNHLLNMHQKKPFSKVMTSPTDRARTMGEAFSACSGLSLEVDEDLREFNFGVFDGLTAKEAAMKEPELWHEWTKDYRMVSLSEQGCFRDFHEALGEWLKHFDYSSDERVLVFTHGGTCNSLLLNLLDLPMDCRWHFAIGNGAIAEIDAPEGFGILKALYSLDNEEK